MKKLMLITLTLFWLNTNTPSAQVVLNELSFGGFLGDFVELKNTGTTAVDISGYWFFTTAPNGAPASVSLALLQTGCGELTLGPDEFIVFDDVAMFIPWSPTLGELALYSTDASGFGDPNDLVDFVSWGTTFFNSITQQLAEAAGQWTVGDFAEGNYDGLSIEYDGEGDTSSDWPFNNMPTICLENDAVMNVCDAVAGTPSTLQLDYCVGDGIADQPTGLTVTGNIGTFSQWVVTEVDGTILQIPADLSEVNFDGAPDGLCIIWHVAHEANIVGLEIGMPVLMMQGCHAVSDAVLIVRSEVDGGLVEGGPFSFCVGDGDPDFVSDVTLSGNIGPSAQWVVTDEQGLILGLPGIPSAVDFDQAPAGTCLIWNLSYQPGIIGLDVNSNISGLEGCFQLSNSITVERFGPSDPECDDATSNNDYVVVGFEDVLLEHSIVHLGGLGATDNNGDIDITDESNVTVDGTFINGPNVRVDKGAKANNICAIPALPELPDFIYNPTDTNDDMDVDIEEDEVVILTESVYEDIDINDGATVTFSGQDFVYIEELDIEDNVTILFDQCTNLMISKKLSIGKYNNFNPGEENVFVFVEDDAEVKKGSTVYGGIYTLKDLRVRKADAGTPTLLYGQFIGEDVKIRDYTELWFENVVPCDPSTPGGKPANTPHPNNQLNQRNTLSANVLPSDRPDMIVYPNPAKKVAYLRVNEEEEQTVQLQVYDISNHLIMEQKDQQLTGNPIALAIDDLPVGVYTVQVVLENGVPVSQKLVVQ